MEFIFRGVCFLAKAYLPQRSSESFAQQQAVTISFVKHSPPFKHFFTDLSLGDTQQITHSQLYG